MKYRNKKKVCVRFWETPKPEKKCSKDCDFPKCNLPECFLQTEFNDAKKRVGL